MVLIAAPLWFLFSSCFCFFLLFFFFIITLGMVKGQTKLAEIEIGRSRNWPKSKLAEVEIGRTRKKNWPKSTTTLLKRCRSPFFHGGDHLLETWRSLPLQKSPQELGDSTLGHGIVPYVPLLRPIPWPTRHVARRGGSTVSLPFPRTVRTETTESRWDAWAEDFCNVLPFGEASPCPPPPPFFHEWRGLP